MILQISPFNLSLVEEFHFLSLQSSKECSFAGSGWADNQENVLVGQVHLLNFLVIPMDGFVNALQRLLQFERIVLPPILRILLRLLLSHPVHQAV